MIRKEDWDAAYRRQLADGQKRLGPPPTFEEVEALSSGQLPEEEAERLRELLSHYPDMLRILTEPFPDTGDGVLSDEELKADLDKLRERIRTTAPPPLAFPRKASPWRTLPLAAGIIIAIALGGVGVWRMTSHARGVVTQVLYPERDRGIGTRGVPSATPAHLSNDTDYLLEPVFDSPRAYREYRLELLDLGTTPPRRVWLRENVTQQRDGTYPVRLSTGELDPGLYHLVLYGVDGTVVELADYTIRLKAK
ncbi:MAG TPA: hypothetical protein VGQ65_02375 [Thermoanaerobaculia bacterium]|jgi:hypothetical protein|nr:hypothetical protein [Thermoanaerobaculia bacterium]